MTRITHFPALPSRERGVVSRVGSAVLHAVRGAMLLAAMGANPLNDPAQAAELVLKNQMTVRGNWNRISEIAENPLTTKSAGGDARTIVIVDDSLRRVFFPFAQIGGTPREDVADEKPIRLKQWTSSSGPRLGSVGSILGVSDFDEWGRRTVTVSTSKGTKNVVQGITEIAPTYTRLESLVGDQSVNWDMRIATSSIPTQTLRKILLRNAEAKGSEARLDIVRLLFQLERYQEASQELELAMKEFPDLQQRESLYQQLTQLGASRVLEEIQLRQKAGQHAYVQSLLTGFPTRDVATENLIRVQESLNEYEGDQAQRKTVLESLETLKAAVSDPSLLQQVERVIQEIRTDLNHNNIQRLADFLRLLPGGQLPDDQKLALGISNWLLGQDAAIQNITVAASLYEVRQLVRDYLRLMGAENQHGRRELLDRITQLEGGTPGYVAKLLLQMAPPHDPPQAQQEIPGYFQITIPHEHPDYEVIYDVQLPPEYDPYRRYPVIVTLHAEATSPADQVTWWSGQYDPARRIRVGQASRYGYIVLAPHWGKPHQQRYDYSAREHAAVLSTLRDAMRRFSIDSDRVFLSGHSMGGEAAWDIGLAHPDLWAGMIPIVAVSDHGRESPLYISLYQENANLLPMYFVFGELDGNRMGDSSIPLNRYLQRNHDVMVIQYQGRGHEHFYDEIQRLFSWMQLHTRNFYPQEFECTTARPWDNFFWYVELAELPSRSMISPISWPAARGARPMVSKVRIGASNSVNVNTGAGRATIWLTPELVDFENRVEISVNSKLHRQEVQPSLETLLEDARTRSDRQHPFWAKVEVNTGRG